MPTCVFDSAEFSARLFFPRPDTSSRPASGEDILVAVADGVRVHVRVSPAPSPRAAIVLFHGNGEIASDYDALAVRFHAAGATLAVADYRGYGRSTGHPSLRACLSDALIVVDAMAARLSQGGVPLPLIVMGRSLGSACAAELCFTRPSRASGFVIESGFSDLRAFAARRGVDLEERLGDSSVDRYDPLPKVARSHAPLLVLHGAGDEIIDAREAEATFAASTAEEKRLVLIPGRGHNDLLVDDRYWAALAAFIHRVGSAADRRAGSLVGQALGDALGFVVEGHSAATCGGYAEAVFAVDAPPTVGRTPFPFGQYTDDTQLARELALSLVEEGGWRPENFARRVAQLFATDSIVGRGRATAAAAERLIGGVHWTVAGEPSPSAGNGASMRAAPVGLRFRDAAVRLWVADEQARVTHLDPRSRAAAVALADTVAAAAAGTGGHRDVDWGLLSDRVRPLDPGLADAMLDVPRLLTLSVDTASDRIARAGSAPRGSGHRFEEWPGISPFATPSVLFALYAFARSPNDLAETLRTSIAVGGDVDTVAAMAGAIGGAAVGLASLEPRLKRWSERLEDRGAHRMRDLVRLAHLLG